MKITRRELHKIIIENLKEEDTLNEFRLGRITGGSKTEMCDLSDIPDVFWRYFKALRTGRKEDLIEATREDIADLEAGRGFVIGSRSAKIEKKKKVLEDLENDESGFFENVALSVKENGTFKLLTLGMSFGATAVFGLTKTDCDAIKERIRIFMHEILAPFFGVDVENPQKNNTKGSLSNDVTTDGGLGIEKFMEDLLDNSVRLSLIDITARKAIIQRESFKKSKLESFDLWIFEMFAEEEYLEYAKDEDADVKSAKPKIKAMLKRLKEETVTYDRFSGTFSRFVTASDPRLEVRRRTFIKDKFPWENYFSSPQEAFLLIKERCKVLMSETDMTLF
jgi:hypothetical protein